MLKKAVGAGRLYENGLKSVIRFVIFIANRGQNSAAVPAPHISTMPQVGYRDAASHVPQEYRYAAPTKALGDFLHPGRR
jgi:hypothetical protein